ncbi:acetyltransferase [Croceiramulus getboli]|nr:acetyltransferase [Flavobacteriaceae bacterium YJPT1-3]
MAYSPYYYSTYQNLPEKLVDTYSDLNFENHCYLRIGLDNIYQAKWDTVIQRPAYKYIQEAEREALLQLLKRYLEDKALLMAHNKDSLQWRQQTKKCIP